MIEGACHCGNISWRLEAPPAWLVDCNCSLCTKAGALWAHCQPGAAAIRTGDQGERRYVQGDGTLAVVFCPRCGCTTHWLPIGADRSRMAVNIRMADAPHWQGIRIRRFDGAASWRFLD
ncbi:GFA family protein [Maricaulis sp. CAU 1757]